MRFVAVEIWFAVSYGARSGGRAAKKLAVLTENVEEGLSAVVVGVVVVAAAAAVAVGLSGHSVTGVAWAIHGHATCIHFEKDIAATIAALLRIEVGVGE